MTDEEFNSLFIKNDYEEGEKYDALMVLHLETYEKIKNIINLNTYLKNKEDEYSIMPYKYLNIIIKNGSTKPLILKCKDEIYNFIMKNIDEDLEDWYLIT
jgi:hypothetical protein